jgi:hypothetical protein
MYYLKLYYKLLDWEWYTDANVMRLFIHCLLKANRFDKKWQGVEIKAGSFITSYENLAFETGLTVMQVRTAIKKLNLTGEITSKTTSRYSMITINNWNEYQADNKQNNNQITNEQQTDNKQITTTRECKNDKSIKSSNSSSNNDENFENEDVSLYGEYQNVALSEKQYQSMLGICASKKLLNEIIEDLSKNIGRGKVEPYSAKFPDAHYIQLRAYYDYRRKYPDKFKDEQIKSSSVNEKWYNEMKEQLVAKGIY